MWREGDAAGGRSCCDIGEEPDISFSVEGKAIALIVAKDTKTALFEADWAGEAVERSGIEEQKKFLGFVVTAGSSCVLSF